MAPEMALGDTVDGRADLYALGCVAYYLLTGRQVFEGETVMQVFAQHLKAAPVPPSQMAPARCRPTSSNSFWNASRSSRRIGPRAPRSSTDASSAVDVEPWTDVHARQWWAAAKPSSGDLDGNVETHRGGRAPGESATRLAIDLRETSSQNEN